MSDLAGEAARILRLQADLVRAYEDRDLAAMLAGPGRVEELRSRFGPDSPFAETLTGLAVAARFLARLASGDAAQVFAALEDIEATMATLPPDSLTRKRLQDMVRALVPMRGAYERHVRPTGDAPPVRLLDLDKLRYHALFDDVPPIERAARFARLAQIVGAMAWEYPGMTSIEIGDLRHAVDAAPPDDVHLPLYLTRLGEALVRRADLIRSRTGRFRLMESGLRPPERTARRSEAEGIATLERAVEAAGGPGAPHWALAHVALSRGYRQAGRHADARRAGLEGLRGHAWRVLLQSHTEAATAALRYATTDALEVAEWHIEDGDAEGAAAALDAGRGLILYAATEMRTVPDRLRAAGAADLAARWPDGPLDGIPGELRKAALRELSAPGGLLDPPPVAEVRAALTAVGAEALVYLVRAGAAVIVHRDGPADILRLPDLDDPPVDTRRPSDSTREIVPEAPDSLAQLCDWAWQAAIGPLLAAVPAGRIVLVPVGELTRVPWHAARGEGRYAIETHAFSYAVSARMLCRTTSVSLDGPVLIVGDPDTGDPARDLAGARAEALAVRDIHPGARYLGRLADGTASPEGAGTPDEVLSWPGGILHLACHGTVREGTGAHDTSYLELSGGRLAAERLVTGRAGTTPGLVVLAACSSSVSGRGWDEAFSIGTAFLSGGAGAVVATQWSVPDEATRHLMVRFHCHLRTMAPAEALRRAQLDALPEAPSAWAGFVHYGA
ncbi:MAG TPA: CHAT domain-containing protein [Dactylosporangium sp.]|nr:CHAT domain-containing protein [Dactylosporangium sp.]